MNIIVDKSWIQGVNKYFLRRISLDNYLLLPWPLGYEIFTSDTRSERKVLIKKLNTVREKIFLLKDLNDIITYELEHQKPFISFEKFYEDISFRMNLENIDNEFNAEQKFILNRYKNYLEVEGPRELLKICEGIDNYFPNLKSGRNSNADDFDNAINLVCSNIDFLKEIYKDIRSTNFP